jgi:hypothetical protein
MMQVSTKTISAEVSLIFFGKIAIKATMPKANPIVDAAKPALELNPNAKGQTIDSLTLAPWLFFAVDAYDKAIESIIQSAIPIISDLTVIDFFNIFGEIFFFLQFLFLKSKFKQKKMLSFWFSLKYLKDYG